MKSDEPYKLQAEEIRRYPLLYNCDLTIDMHYAQPITPNPGKWLLLCLQGILLVYLVIIIEIYKVESNF